MRTPRGATWIRVLLLCTAALCALARVAAAVEVRRITLPTRALVADPVRQRIYASVPGISIFFGNKIVRIDPATGKVEDSVYVGSEPGPIAIDANATVLYVGLDGTGQIVRVDLATFKVDLIFGIGSATGAFLAEDIAVMPRNPEVIAARHSSRRARTSKGECAVRSMTLAIHSRVGRPRSGRGNFMEAVKS